MDTPEIQQPQGTTDRLRRRVGVAIAVAAAVITTWAVFRPGAYPWYLLRIAASHVAGNPVKPDKLLAIDDFYQRCPTGNIYLVFRGFDSDNIADQYFVAQYYYRPTYTLYPRRVFVCLENTPISGTDAIFRHNQPPTTAWLRAHDVHYVVFFTNEGGHRRFAVEAVPRDAD